MTQAIDLESILAPIPGDDPAGEDLRYTPIYEEIKEARRADDPLDRGDWQREIKTADWRKVISLSVEVLTKRTKDLQIAAWLTEALINTEGFQGLVAGLKILTRLLTDYWDHVYPKIEEGDLDFRAAPIEYVNEKLWVYIKQIPLTERSVTPGYAWLKWQESREVGFESALRNRYGDIDENKKQAREEKIAEGKLTGEEFDSAVKLSSRAFYTELAKSVNICMEEFKTFDSVLDEKFGSNAPRLAEFKSSLEDCEQLVGKILKEKKGGEPVPEPEPPNEKEGGVLSRFFKKQRGASRELEPQAEKEAAAFEKFGDSDVEGSPLNLPTLHLSQLLDSGSVEKARWNEALQALETSGIKSAVGQLLAASYSSPSVRERNRYRLLTARLCLKAERPDLARPIVEELHALIEELHLEKWESPLWIAEVLDALYQCLTQGEPSDEDTRRADELFKKLCTADVTKAMTYGY